MCVNSTNHAAYFATEWPLWLLRNLTLSNYPPPGMLFLPQIVQHVPCCCLVGGVFSCQRAAKVELTVRRTNWWRRWYELQEREMVLGSARPRGVFRRETIVQFTGQEYVLGPAGFWNRRWRLTNDEGTILLEICSQGLFRRGAHLAILDTVDVALLVFTYYLVHMRWQEEASAAS
jgi:hypothetical protein